MLEFEINRFLVCLSLLGIFIVKCSSTKNRLFVGDVFLGLAVSTMLGDSILHILPAVLGLHNHDEEKHDDHGSHEDHSDSGHDDTEYYMVVGKLGTLVGAMYLFWIIESFMTILGRGHSHSHGSDHGKYYPFLTQSIISLDSNHKKLNLDL